MEHGAARRREAAFEGRLPHLSARSAGPDHCCQGQPERLTTTSCAPGCAPMLLALNNVVVRHGGVAFAGRQRRWIAEMMVVAVA